MKINRDGMIRIVKSARIANKLDEAISGLVGSRTDNLAEYIFGYLADVIFDMLNEKGTVKDFNDSITYRLLTGDMSDEAVADFVIMKDKILRRIVQETDDENIDLPAPQIMSKESVDELYRQNGGYRSTPEGDWK